MSDRDALMRAVLDQLADDEPRLILADWFEEHGQAERAEFIRVQCEIARGVEGGRERLEALAARENALYEARDAAWSEGVPKWGRDKVYFRRGFPSSLWCTPTQWLGARKLTHSVPIESLYLARSDVPGRLTALAECEHLTVLTALQASLEHEFTPSLFGSPHLGNLRWLDLGRGGYQHGRMVGDSVAAVLARAPTLAHLEGLRLASCELGPRGLADLAGSPYLTRLRRLDVDENFCGDAGIEALAGSPLSANLVALNLRAASSPAARLGERSIAALARFPRLTHLNLTLNAIGQEGTKVLAASPNLGGLEYLSLYGNSVGDEGLRALARSPHLTRLRTLDLGANDWTTKGLEALGTSSAFPALERLGLQFGTQQANTPGLEAAARALVGSPNLRQLREVSFYVEYWLSGFVRRELETRFAPLHGKVLLERRW